MEAPKIIDLLKEEKVPYILHEHPAVFTVEEANQFKAGQPGGHCKNMLLTNKKRDKFYLIVLESHKKMNFKEIGETIGVKGLKFAKESTLHRFGTIAGAVSPFIILEDLHQEITLYLDNDLTRFEKLNFHPNDNTMTLGIETNAFLGFMEQKKHEAILIG